MSHDTSFPTTTSCLIQPTVSNILKARGMPDVDTCNVTVSAATVQFSSCALFLEL